MIYNKGLNKGESMESIEPMINYLEYWDLLESWSHKDLELAWEAIHNNDLQETLYAEESPLLAFLIDVDLQEKLNLYFEDIQRDNSNKEKYGW